MWNLSQTKSFAFMIMDFTGGHRWRPCRSTSSTDADQVKLFTLSESDLLEEFFSSQTHYRNALKGRALKPRARQHHGLCYAAFLNNRTNVHFPRVRCCRPHRLSRSSSAEWDPPSSQGGAWHPSSLQDQKKKDRNKIKNKADWKQKMSLFSGKDVYGEQKDPRTVK